MCQYAGYKEKQPSPRGEPLPGLGVFGFLQGLFFSVDTLVSSHLSGLTVISRELAIAPFPAVIAIAITLWYFSH